MSGGGCGKIKGCGIVFECALKFFIRFLESEEYFITLLIITETRRIVRLDEIQIEIPLRNGSGAFIRCAEEQVAGTCGSVFLPGQLVLPDLIAGNISSILAFHDAFERFVVKTIQLRGP